MTGPKTILILTSLAIRAAADADEPAVIGTAAVCLADPTEFAELRTRAAKEYVVNRQLPSCRAMLDREDSAAPRILT